MTTRIQNLSDLQDRRIMMEKKLPAFGYALILLVAFLMVFLVIWSTQNKRTYVSQSTGSVQAANKTYIMSSYSGSITELNISEGSYVTEGDLIAHIKSTDLDIQQDSYQKQLDIYKKQKSQYEKLLKSIQDDKNYFSETDIDDQPYYYQYESYKSQVSQKAFDASPYQAAGYTDEQIKTMMEQNQSEVESLYYSTLQSISANLTSVQASGALFPGPDGAFLSGSRLGKTPAEICRKVLTNPSFHAKINKSSGRTHKRIWACSRVANGDRL